MSPEGKSCSEIGNLGCLRGFQHPPPPPSLRPHLNWPVMCGHTSAGKPPSKSGCTGCMCTLLAGNSSISLARSEEQINFFPSNLSKCLKWLQKVLFTLRCCSQVFFSKFPVGCPCRILGTFISQRHASQADLTTFLPCPSCHILSPYYKLDGHLLNTFETLFRKVVGTSKIIH